MIKCDNCGKEIGRREDVGDVHFCSDLCQSMLEENLRRQKLQNTIGRGRSYFDREAK